MGLLSLLIAAVLVALVIYLLQRSPMGTPGAPVGPTGFPLGRRGGRFLGAY